MLRLKVSFHIAGVETTYTIYRDHWDKCVTQIVKAAHAYAFALFIFCRDLYDLFTHIHKWL